MMQEFIISPETCEILYSAKVTFSERVEVKMS